MESVITTILQEKAALTGIAILLIIACHLVVVDPHLLRTYPILKVLVPGFIGVDIFLFYSGYSLGYSFQNRRLKNFYLRRVSRIYPLYVVFAILSTIVIILKGTHVSFWDWFCNITTLSYYNLGGNRIDWYLSSLFLFYLAYPIAIQFVRKFKMIGVFFVLLSVYILTTCYVFYEYYGCALSRIPIFVFGIYIYIYKDCINIQRHYYILSSLFLLIFASALIIMKQGFPIHGYFLVDTVTPLLLLGLSVFVFFVYRKLRFFYIIDILSFMGKYSLEIYISNYLSMIIIGLFHELDMYSIALMYLGLNVAGTILMIFTNKGLKEVINYMQ